MDYIGIIKERKIIDGKLYKSYFIDSEGKPIGIPIGVTMTKGGGIFYISVRLNKKKYPDAFRTFTPYTDKITQEHAYRKSIGIINSLGKGSNKTCYSTRFGCKKVALHPEFDIDLSEVPIGVAVHSCVSKGYPFLKITVTCFDPTQNKFRPKGLYAGTPNTWRRLYLQKLQEAITLREESLKLYNELTQVTK